jgi:ribonuclease Z
MLNLTILGSGAATPTLKRGVTAQYLNFNERKILIDCGEGTQLQLRKFKISFQRLQFIFISHLHGDHYLGLMGLLSSMHLLGRTKPIHLFAPPELQEILETQFRLTYVKLKFDIIYHPLKFKEKTLIFEDNIIEVFAFPLKHRIPCYGFLFKEKTKERGMIKEKIKELDIKIPEILKLKVGKNVIRKDGSVLNYLELTTPPDNPKSYAFCTDTKYIESLNETLRDVDLLYHEATFIHSLLKRAKATFHTTAFQAATLAKNAHVGQLLLGHFSQRYSSTKDIEQEAKSIFENTICVKDGDNFVL